MQIGFAGVLFMVLLVLKLTEVIAVSWWVVTAPIWAPALIAIVVFAIAAVIVYKAEKKQ